MAGQKISQGNIFGRIGSSIGTGLAEQIPKEAERYRLKEGLSQLEKDAPNLTPAQTYIRAASIPGISPATQQGLPEVLRYSAVSKGLENYGKGNGGTSSKGYVGSKGFSENAPTFLGQKGQGVQGSKHTEPQQDQYNKTQGNITTPRETQNYINPIHHPSQDEIIGDAQEISQRDGIPIQDAIPIAQKNADAQVANQQENITAKARSDAVDAAVKQDIQNRVAKFTNKIGNELHAVVPGEYVQRFESEALNKVSTGELSDKEAGAQAAEKINSLYKDVTSLRNDLDVPFLRKTPRQTTKDIMSKMPKFRALGAQELAKNELIENVGQGVHKASLLAYGVSKGVEDALINSSVKDSPRKMAAFLINRITPDDSIFAIGHLIDKLGINDVDVINELQSMANEGLFKPDDRQKREMQAYYPNNETLRDLLWESALSPTGPFLQKKASVRERVKMLIGN